MTSQTDHQRVEEITGHIGRLLVGIPGVSVSGVATIAFSWLRESRPEVLEVLTNAEIHELIEVKVNDA
ncbi:MAG: hypothetical protein RIC89_19150 [Pseudomonadales bacterium]